MVSVESQPQNPGLMDNLEFHTYMFKRDTSFSGVTIILDGYMYQKKIIHF